MDSKVLGALRELSSSLDSAVRGIGTTVNSGSLVNALKGLNNGLSKTSSSISIFNSKTSLFVYTMKEVGEIMSEAALRMTSAARDLVEAEQRLATVNTTLSQTTLKQINGIDGIVGGSRLAAQAFTEFRVMGFKEVNANLIDLGNRMKLTSQNTDGLLKLGGFLLGPGGMNEKQIDALSKTIVDTSLKTGLALDDVVEGVATLSDNIASQAMMGTSARVAQAQALFQRFAPGPQMADQFAELSKIMLTDPEFLFQVAAPAGVLPDLRKLKRDPTLSDSAILNLQVKILRQIAAHSDNIVGTTRDGNRATDELVYQSLLNNNQLVRFGEQARFLLSRAQEEGDSGVDSISELLINFRQQLLGPFNNAVALLMPSFKKFMADLIEFGTSVLNGISYFEPFISDFLDSFGGFFRFAGTVIEESMAFIGPVFESVFSSFKELFSSLGASFNRIELATLHLAKIFSTGEEDKRIQVKIDRINLSTKIKDAAQAQIEQQLASGSPNQALMDYLKGQAITSRMLATELMQGKDIDSIPAFADGGIVNKSTIAQIGEAGSEAVIPLKNGSVPVELKSKGSNAFKDGLDTAQAGLTVAGMTPLLGIIPDVINTLITGSRLLAGDDRVSMSDLAFDAAAMIPLGAGQAAATAKLTKKTAEVLDGVGKGNKLLKKSVELAAKPLSTGSKFAGSTLLPGGKVNRAIRAGSALNRGDLESIDQASIEELLLQRFNESQRDNLTGQKSVTADSALMDAIYGMGSARGIPSTQQAEAITRSVDLREQNKTTKTISDFEGSDYQKQLLDKLNNLELHLPNEVRDLIGTESFTDKYPFENNLRLFEQFKGMAEGDLKTVRDYFKTKSTLAGITDVSRTETTGKFKNLRDPNSLVKTITEEMIFDPATRTFDADEIPEASRKAMFDFNRFRAVSYAAKAELEERKFGSLPGWFGHDLTREIGVEPSLGVAGALGLNYKDQVKGISSDEFMHMMGSRMEAGPSYLNDIKTKASTAFQPVQNIPETPFIPYTDTTGMDKDFLMGIAPKVGEYGNISQKDIVPQFEDSVPGNITVIPEDIDRKAALRAKADIAEAFGGKLPGQNFFQGMNFEELMQAQVTLGSLQNDFENSMFSANTEKDLNTATEGLRQVLSLTEILNNVLQTPGGYEESNIVPLPEIDERSVPQNMEPFSRVTNRDDMEIMMAVRDQLRDSSEKQMGFLEQIAAASEKTAGNTKPKVDIGAGFSKAAGGR